jgi:hypothetical protein
MAPYKNHDPIPAANLSSLIFLATLNIINISSSYPAVFSVYQFPLGRDFSNRSQRLLFWGRDFISFMPERIFIADIVPLWLVFNVNNSYEILFWK